MVTRPHGDQERALDAGLVHLSQIVVDRYAVAHFGLYLHLVHKAGVQACAALVDLPPGVEVGDDVEMTGQDRPIKDGPRTPRRTGRAPAGSEK